MRRESSLLNDNQNLLILDIVVKLKDGSIVNVERQKIGYKFPGQRACCYSSDLVLRQYGAGKKREEKLPLLQHYVFVPLDIFRKCIAKKEADKLTELEAWLLFLSSDDPEDIFRIVKEYPEFEELYKHIFDICKNTEGMIDMFSKELSAIDHNTVRYMVDELQNKVKEADEK